MNPRAIHEMTFKSIIDGFNGVHKTVKGAIDTSDKKGNQRFDYNYVAKSSSIARASSGLVCTYPVLCSSSLDIKSCMMIGKALERRNVTMLQMLLAACQRTNENVMDYIKNFHTNLDFDKISLDDFVDILTDSKPYAESMNIPQALMDMIPLKEKSECLNDFRMNCNYFFKDNISESSISKFKEMDRNGYSTIIEAEIIDSDSTDNVIKDSKGKPITKNNEERTGYRSVDGVDSINKMTAPNIDKDRLISSEIKKANEMVPSLMLINTIDPNTGVNQQAVIGVKSRLIPVPYNEITNRIISHYQDSNALLKFIKLTTREISFIKDFLFAVDSAKLDAINNSKKGSATSLFQALERRSQKGKVRKLARTEKQFAKAISSLVISQEDVEELKKNFNIDVELIQVMKPIMERLNLLYFVIVDESSETIKLLIDGADGYEEYTFSSLEKEAKDDSYKKVINLMTRMTN